MAAGPGLYSRVVAVLKVGLPLIALALLAGLFLAPREEERGVVFSPGDVEAFGEGLQISNATFTGTTRGDDRFRFTADLVVPDAAPPERAAITRPAGTIELKGGPVVTVEAATGDLHVPSQRLDLVGELRAGVGEGDLQVRRAQVEHLGGLSGAWACHAGAFGDGRLASPDVVLGDVDDDDIRRAELEQAGVMNANPGDAGGPACVFASGQ